MSSSLNRIKKNIIEAMQSANNQGTSAYDSVAEVRRVEGDTAWVHIAGGVDETPVKLTIAAKAGDVVQVRVGGGRAWITGNASAPPTDDKTAITAKSLANIAGNRAKIAQKVADQAQIAANSALKGTKENAAQMAQMILDFNGDIEGLQDQIDGNIATWFYDIDPAMSLPPVTDWGTDEEKNAHLGDIYYNTVKGYAWRFMKSGNTYSWERITDTDVTKALADAAKAQDTADSKRRVFYNTPTVPYDAGDLWVQGSGGDILRCAQAKTSTGSYDRNDWVLASKYTDNSALNAWIEGDFAATIQELEEGLADAKVETYYQTTDPSTGWSDTQKSEHKGDLWYNSTASVQKYYRWSGTAWQELTATPPQAVFDNIDKKATIYIGTTTPTNPDSGDLWFKGANEPILTYVDNSWVEYNKYTDDSAVNNLKIGGANIIQDMSKWYISPNYGFINKANAHENLIARKNDNVFRADGVVNSGVTFTRIDGSNTAWHIEGTATTTLDYVVTGTDKESYALPITIGTYTLSKTIKNNSGDEPQVMISVSNSSMAYKTQYNTNGGSVTFNTTTDAKYWRYCGIRLVSGKTYNCDVYIKLESGSSATPYSISPSDLENDADTVVLTKRATANWSNNIKPYPIIKMSDAWGKDFTLSFDWKATSDTEQPSLGFYTFKDAMMPNIWGVAGAYNMPRIANLVVGSKVGGYIVNLENNKISSNWTRCVVTFRIDSADWFTTGSELYDYFGFNIVSYYGSTENTLYIKNVKFEIGNKATSWTPSTDETTKLLKRVVIGDDSVDIVDSAGRLLASYGDVKIELGKNAVSSIIEMCGGMARVSARYGGLTTIYSHNGGYQTTLDYDFNETKFKSKVGSNYGFYEFSYSGGVWECSYSGNNAGYVQVNLSDYGITLKTTSINEYAGITIQYWNGSEATFINADTTKPSRKLILGLAESGTADNLNYANIEIERSKKGDVEHSKINLLTVHDGANVAGIYLNDGNIGLDVSGEVRINNIPLDYIVEQGTYIGWKYRKWNSGIAECFGYISLGSISVSAVGNVYRGTATVVLPAIFNDIPSNVHITNGNPLASVISINGRATDADHVLVYVWKSTSGAVDSVYASFHVIGTWK